MSSIDPVTTKNSRTGSVVFVDADDTLWENNVFFSRVIEAWVAFVGERGVDRDTALLTLHEEEDRNIPVTGYGARPFCASLRSAFRRVVCDPGPGDLVALETFAVRAEAAIRDHAIELLPGVEDGLRQLAATGVRMVVLTKGQEDEQSAKVARSGLAPFFGGVRVVAEKDVATYETAARAEGVPATSCWMIGNSPRSDINPARVAGMRTVHVPHAAPWHRELAPFVKSGAETVVVHSFADVPAAIVGAGPAEFSGRG